MTHLVEGSVGIPRGVLHPERQVLSDGEGIGGVKVGSRETACGERRETRAPYERSEELESKSKKQKRQLLFEEISRGKENMKGDEGEEQVSTYRLTSVRSNLRC